MSHFARFLAGIYSPLVESLSSPNRRAATQEAVAICAAAVRRYDPDRYFASLFAKEEGRRALFALYAFNLEIAKTRETVSEPMLGQIRLQWWREAIEGIYRGAPRDHAAVIALAEAIARHDPTRARFDRLIDAREFDLEDRPPETLEELVAYAEASAGELVCLALEMLGARDEAAMAAGRAAGTTWALTGLLRAVPHHAAQGRSYLPGIAGDQLRQTPDAAPVRAATEDIAAAAHDARATLSRQARNIPKASRPALLHVTLVDADLRRIEKTGFDPFAAREITPGRRRLSIVGASITGRI